LAAYKRSILIINPKFQFKISFLVCFLVLVSTVLYPVTIYEIVEQFIAASPDKAEWLANLRNDLFWVLALVQFGMLGLIFISMIFISHKIAGPMFKLKSHLQAIRNTQKIEPVYFRKGDSFTDIADEFNKTMESIKTKRDEDFAYLEEIGAYIANLSLVIPDDKKPVLQEIQHKLLEIQNRYK